VPPSGLGVSHESPAHRIARVSAAVWGTRTVFNFSKIGRCNTMASSPVDVSPLVDCAHEVPVRHQEINEHPWRGEMTSKVSRGRRERGFLGLLRGPALIAVLAGAEGAVAFLLRAGGRSDSRILLVLFAIWVLSPFMALALAEVISKHWSVLTRATLYIVMLVLTLGSLAIYGDGALRPPRAKAAFVFLVVPLASWLLIAIVVPIAALISGRLSRRGGGA
jgi:hypothetical protein